MLRVAFDIGNVLCHFDISKFTTKLSQVLGVSDHDAYFFLDHIQASQDIGVTTVAKSLEYKFKLNAGEMSELLDAWNDTLKPSEQMLNFMDNLRDIGIKIALLSNMGPEHASFLRSTCPRMFDDTIQHLSFEVGARKPTKLFFQSFCLNNDDFSSCLYLDDIEENLKAGKKFGFKVYRFHLDEFNQLPPSRRKMELDKIQTMIINNV